jgi:hypothetical protein
MKIAPGVEAKDWKSLDLSEPDNPDWERAIVILEKRTRGRFTDTIEFLIADDGKRRATERRFGFAILALDCLLVETLEAFRQGLTDTRRRSADLCISFLTQRTAFKQFFTADLAKRFYNEFRCGLAHNAQVFGSGRIWSVGPLLQQDHGRITINRSAFHQALVAELEAYLNELRVPANTTLRGNFRKKMNFIADGKFVR